MGDSVVIGAALAHRIGYGGHAWALLQYVRGFRALGFEVTVIDRLEPGMLGRVRRQSALGYLWGLLADERVSYCVLGGDGSALDGLSREEALAKTRDARFLLNVMGFVIDHELLTAARRRVFLDIDPGFAQVWRELDLADVFAGHDDLVTVGRCPVVEGGSGFTSVGSWRGPYDRIEYRGRSLGLRVHEFRKFVGLPGLVDAPFRVALEIDPSDQSDLALLGDTGWQLVDPRDAAHDTAAYLQFVQGSLAEFTVAKGIYVELQSGWLGDRTACYLASGKPALVQDTGLASHYPLGEGLVAFSTVDEAVAGVERILSDYPAQARAARRLAETEFDARIVLSRLLEELGG
jgi:hypothetical protein